MNSPGRELCCGGTGRNRRPRTAAGTVPPHRIQAGQRRRTRIARRGKRATHRLNRASKERDNLLRKDPVNFVKFGLTRPLCNQLTASATKREFTSGWEKPWESPWSSLWDPGQERQPLASRLRSGREPGRRQLESRWGRGPGPRRWFRPQDNWFPACTRQSPAVCSPRRQLLQIDACHSPFFGR